MSFDTTVEAAGVWLDRVVEGSEGPLWNYWCVASAASLCQHWTKERYGYLCRMSVPTVAEPNLKTMTRAGRWQLRMTHRDKQWTQYRK